MLYYGTMKRNTDIILLLLALLLLAGCAGCNTTPQRVEKAALLPLLQVSDSTAVKRATALKKVLAPMKERGAGITLSAYRNRILPEKTVLEAVKKLGFNRIYCSISSESELGDDLKRLVVSAASAGIPVYLAVRQGDFQHRFRGNAFIRSLLPQYRRLPDLAEDIADFNDSLPADAKLAGVAVRFEPHLFTAENGADRIPGLHYIWSDVTFGIGLDNDKLTELSVKLLHKMKKNLKKLPLFVELPDFYPVWVAEKKLSKGKAADFAGLDGVMIQCTGNKPREIVRKFSEASGKNKNIQAVIPLAGHTSVRTGALRRRDWNDLTRSAGYIVDSLRKMNCSGVVLRPLSELGFMILEQD